LNTASPLLLALGLATPTHGASQSQALAMGVAATLEDPSQAALVAGLYKRSGVDRRASVLLNTEKAEGESLDQDFFSASDDGCWPTTAERMRAFDASAGALAIRAARSALAQAGISPDEITDLVTVSCTGLSAPGVDIALMTGISLPAGVRRLNIGFMGCHGAIVALRTASALAAARSTVDHRPPRVLAVCIELCSLHLQRTARVDRHVSNALFADGCAAMVVGNAPSVNHPSTADASINPPEHMATPKHAHAVHLPPLRIVDTSSMLFPDSTSAMGWQIGDHGFEMTLDRSVPKLLELHLSEWVWPWVRSHLGSAAGQRDVRWAIHPGGPRVLDAVASALSLGTEEVRDSRTVLREHGNMSSPTVLFIVERLRSSRDDHRPIVALAFGPGLTGEAALMHPLANADANVVTGLDADRG
jgi:predicted naringenin-chalcone synthase